MRIRSVSFHVMIIFLAVVIVLAVRLFHYDSDALQGDTRNQYQGQDVIGKGVDYPPAWDKVIYPPGAPKIISHYRARRWLRGKRKIHQGIDIWGPPGQPIIAVAAGYVIETYTGKCAGPTVVIDHGRDKDGKPLIAWYVHVQDILVKEGRGVSRGDVVARLGDNYDQFECTGGKRHLHLELGRTRGSKHGINPHLLWADGPYRVTCFDGNRDYPSGTLTYPMPCAKAPDLPRSG